MEKNVSKKAVIFLISIIAAICLMIGSLLFSAPSRVHAAATDRITFSESEKVFNSFNDFTYEEQGYRNWYYLYGQPSQPSSWKNSSQTITYDLEYWRGSNAYTLIGKSTEEIKYLAGEVNETAVHGWMAPASGTVDISVTARNGGSCPFDGDIWLGGVQLQDEWALQSGTETKEYSGQTVEAGDFFYFSITQTSGSVAGGEVYAVITITYTSVNEDSIVSLETLIDTLPAEGNVQAGDIEAIVAAYEQAAAMDSVSRAFVSSEKAEKLLTIYSEALVLDAQLKIDALPALENMTVDTMETDKELIDSARTAFDILTQEEQAEISNSGRLSAAEEKYAGLLITAELSPLIEAIPATVTAEDKDAVLTALSMYNSFTAEQQEYVGEEDLTKLMNAVNAIAELEKESTMTFNSAYGFTSVQGENNWYYEYRSNNTFTLMNSYNSSEQAHNGGSAYTFVYNSGIHPADDPVRKFVAPYDGIVNIRGWAYKTDAGCDIELTVLQNETDLFASDPIDMITASTSASQRVQFEALQVAVQAGDEIRFVYHTPNGSSYGETRSVVEIEYVEAIDMTLSLAHKYTFDSAIPDEIEIGSSVHLSGEVSPADSTEEIEFVVAYMENAYAAKNSTPLAASDAYIDEDGNFRALVAGEYSILAMGTDSKAVIAEKNIVVKQSTSARVNNSYYDFDSSLSVNPQSGQGNWYYMNYEVASRAFTECVSNFQDTYYQGALQYVLMGRQENILHDTSNYPARAWKAPVSGQVEFSIVARIVSGPQFEVVVCVNSDEDVRISDWIVDTTSAQGKTITVDVEAGDMIYVIIQEAGGGTSGSSFYTTMTAKYLSIQSEAVTAVEAAISTLPDTITLGNEGAVTAAAKAYEELSDLEKSFISADNFQKLTNAQNIIAALNVETEIDALPALSELTEDHAEEIEAAYDAYEALTAEQKLLVSNYADLIAADNRLAAIPVDDMIERLPAIGELTLADAENVEKAAEAYLLLTTVQQEYVYNYATLVAAEEIIADLQADADAVAAVEEKIDAIPDTITRNDVAAIESAWASYNQLDDALQAMVDNEKVNKLNAALAILKSFKEADAVIAMIDALPESVSLANEEAVEAAEEAYAALGVEAKGYVDNYSDLQAARLRIDELNKGVAVREQIDDLPAVVTLVDKESVETVRNAYEALSDDAKVYVTNYAKLTAAEAAIAELEDRAAAEAVIAMIDALPETIALADKAAIESARSAYDKLTATQKEFVTNYNDLTSAESAIAALEENDSPSDDNDSNIDPGEDTNESGGCSSFVGGVSVLFGGIALLVVSTALIFKKKS